MRKLREEFKHDYNAQVQAFLLSCMISDSDVFARTRSIVRDEYFDDQLSSAARFILHHADEFRTIPDCKLIEAKTGIRLEPLPPEEIFRQRDWFFKEIEGFCRYRAVENVILDGIDLLRAGEGAEVDRRIREAMTISLNSDLGTSYFSDPRTRLERLLDRSSIVSTGWKLLDDKLYGGFSRGGLNVFAGGSGSGKSLVLQNLALNWAFAGFTVIYITLELSEDLVALRLDSMVSGKSTKEVLRNVDESALFIGMKGKKSGQIYIKKMPEGSTTTNDLRAFLKEFEIQTGKKPDAILVDYLDLMYPNNQRVDAANLFVKDKFVSEELRALMHEANAFGSTASQLNRGSLEAQGEFDHSHIAGGISKINTADNVMAIYAPPNLKERGEYDLMFLKTRSSSAVGQRIKLRYDQDCMRITDPDGVQGSAPVDRPSNRSELKSEMAAKMQGLQEQVPGLSAMLRKNRSMGI